MMNPWLGMGLVLAIFGGLMVGLQAYRRRRSPHPELTRKLLHVGMGLVALTLPWLFAQAWPVLVLVGVTVIILTAVKRSATLQGHLGGVIDGVARESLGEIYFPLAVGLVFLLSRGHASLFCIPILILTLADTVAALIGMRYGRLRYATVEGSKSIEGSFAFFAVAFLSTHIPLLLFTDSGPAKTLLIAMTLALLVMLLEAIAWRGLDNLLVPLGAFALLRAYLAMDVATLTVQLGVMISLTILAMFWRRRAIFTDSKLLGDQNSPVFDLHADHGKAYSD